MNKKFVFAAVLITIGILCAALIINCVYVIVMHNVGYDYRVVTSNREIGIPSRDGRYRLAEMSDTTGQYLLYSVIQLQSTDEDDLSEYPKTVYVTNDFWYHSRFVTDYGWIDDGSNSFFIKSSDSGTHCYIFTGATWIPEP